MSVGLGPLAPSGRTVSEARAWGVLALLSMLYIVSFVDRMILALLIEPIKSDLGISDVQVGLLIGTSFAIVFSIAGLPLARLADTRNRTLLIFCGALAWGLSTAAAAFATSFEMLLLLRIGVAVGEAALTPAAISLLADMFRPSKRSLAISIYVTVGVCGGAGAMLVGAGTLHLVAQTSDYLGALANLGAWRLTLLFVGVPAVVLALFIPLVIPHVPRTQDLTPTTGSFADLRAHYAGHKRTYIGFYIVTGLVSSINFSILTWFPTHVIRTYLLSPSTVGFVFGTGGIVASLAGGLLLPYVSRRMIARGQHDAPLLIAIGVACVSSPLLILALLAPNATVSLGAMFVPLALQTGLGILLASTAPLLAPSGIRAQLVAAYFLVLTLVGLGAGPTLVAWIAEHWSIAQGSIGYALAGVVMVFAPLQVLVIIRTRHAFARTFAAANSFPPTDSATIASH